MEQLVLAYDLQTPAVHRLAELPRGDHRVHPSAIGRVRLHDGYAAQLATHARQDNQALVAIIDADPAVTSVGRPLATLLAEHATPLTVIEPPDGLDLKPWASIDNAWTRPTRGRAPP